MALRSRLWEWLPVCRNPGCGVAAFSTSSKPAPKPDVDPLENAAVAPEFTNRNPRNLELLGVARKERGWGTAWPSREFWHSFCDLKKKEKEKEKKGKTRDYFETGALPVSRRTVPGTVGAQQTAAAALPLRVIRTQHHVEARVEHCSGQVVVSASTREWAIKKHLYSTRNVVACESVGRVLAERCLEAGINFMVYQPTPWEAASDSMKRLQSAMTEGGVVLQEPRRIYE